MGYRKRFEKGIPNGRFQIYGYRWDGDHLVIHEEEGKDCSAHLRQLHERFISGDHRKAACRDGCENPTRVSISATPPSGKFSATSHYGQPSVPKGICGRSHQQEKQDQPRGSCRSISWRTPTKPSFRWRTTRRCRPRKRAAGSLGLWQTGALTPPALPAKIKCGRCGKSYQRSNRKGEKKTLMPTTPSGSAWTRRKTGNAHCQNKDIPEQMLKEACAAVLGLDTFDEIIFSEQIDRIEIPAPNEMIFYFKDGRIVPHHWESTMRKDCWTDERRAAKGRYVQEHQLGPNTSCFTSRIRCDSCGENYRRQRSRHKDGSFDSVWRCASGGKCQSPSIKEDALKNLCADAMGLEEFSETVFREQIACIHIVAPFQLSIRFFDGHTFEAAWENKRKMPKHTEAAKTAYARSNDTEMEGKTWRK